MMIVDFYLPPKLTILQKSLVVFDRFESDAKKSGVVDLGTLEKYLDSRAENVKKMILPIFPVPQRLRVSEGYVDVLGNGGKFAMSNVVDVTSKSTVRIVHRKTRGTSP